MTCSITVLPPNTDKHVMQPYLLLKCIRCINKDMAISDLSTTMVTSILCNI